MRSGPATAMPTPIRRTGRPSAADDLRLELAAREAEELAMAADLGPLVRRLRLLANGPVATATVTALDQALARHARRWSPPTGGEAA